MSLNDRQDVLRDLKEKAPMDSNEALRTPTIYDWLTPGVNQFYLDKKKSGQIVYLCML